MSPLAEDEGQSYQYSAEPFQIQTLSGQLYFIFSLFIQQHKDYIWLLHSIIEILLLFPLNVFLNVLRMEVQDSWEAASEEEVFSLSGAVLHNGFGDVYHEDCLRVKGFWVIAWQDALITPIDHVSGEQHKFLVDTRTVVMLAESLSLIKDIQPRSVDPSQVLLPADELIGPVQIGKGNIAQELKEGFLGEYDVLKDEEREGAVHECVSVGVVKLDGVVVVGKDGLCEGGDEGEVGGDDQEEGVVFGDGEFAFRFFEGVGDEAMIHLHQQQQLRPICHIQSLMAEQSLVEWHQRQTFRIYIINSFIFISQIDQQQIFHDYRCSALQSLFFIFFIYLNMLNLNQGQNYIQGKQLYLFYLCT